MTSLPIDRLAASPVPQGVPIRPVSIVGLLGLNCWATCVALPIWHIERLGALSGWALGGAVAGLLVLALGVLGLARRHRLASLALAVFVPAAMLAPAAAQPTLVRASVMSPAAVAVAGISFAAYLIGACWASSAARVRSIDVRAKSLEDHTPRRFKWLSWCLLGTAVATVLVAIATGHLLPIEATGARIRLLSAGALILWATALFGIIAPALRHRQPWPMATASRGAAVVWLLVAVIGGVMLALSLME